ncbi:MAG: hypothetical protein LH629_14275 [Ignavibacteria bacterium]|nr:hypothetical protein [Ignavibacteria bacterium]
MGKLILLFLITGFISIAGCENKNEVSGEKKDQIKTEEKKETKSETSVKTEDMKKTEEVKPETVQSENNKANELGMTPGLPGDFPADVPQPKNSKALGSLNSSDGTVVTFESKDKVIDIVNFYKEEMKKTGYTITEGGENIVSDKGGLINWTKEKKEVGLTLGYDKDKNITSLVITYK